MNNVQGTLVLVLIGLWVILQTTRGPLAQKIGFTS